MSRSLVTRVMRANQRFLLSIFRGAPAVPLRRRDVLRHRGCRDDGTAAGPAVDCAEPGVQRPRAGTLGHCAGTRAGRDPSVARDRASVADLPERQFPGCRRRCSRPGVGDAPGGAGLLLGVDVVAQVDPRGIDYDWMRFARGERENAPDSETAVIARGGISVTPLFFERTDEGAFDTLNEALRG